MSETSERIARMEEHAGRLQNHIAKIRIDFPEAADARRQELHDLYRDIAAARRSTQKGDDDGR